jgi:hypothetical protein
VRFGQLPLAGLTAPSVSKALLAVAMLALPVAFFAAVDLAAVAFFAVVFFAPAFALDFPLADAFLFVSAI